MQFQHILAYKFAYFVLMGLSTNILTKYKQILLNSLYITGDSMMAKARSFGDRELFKKAQHINTPSCDSLHQYLS